MSTNANTSAATTPATAASTVPATAATTASVNTSSIPTMMPTPGRYPSSSTTPWEFVNPFGPTGGSTSSGSVGSTFSGSFGSFNGSSAGAFGSHASVGASGLNTSVGSFGINTNAGAFGSHANAGAFGSHAGASSFGAGTTMAGAMPNMNGGGSMPNHVAGSSGVNLNGSYHGPSSVPLIPRMMPPAEKPSKFGGSDFKRWQQKMLFYLTTLGVVHFLKEDEPPTPSDQETRLEVFSDYDAWLKGDYLCKNFILSALDDSLYNVYSNVTTSKQMWENLEKK